MSDLVQVCIGHRFRVSMTAEVARAFERCDAKERARCRKWMALYADDGGDLLDNTKFKFEGRFSIGASHGTRVPIFVFKAWQLRVYGGHLPGGTHFVATEIDVAKKRDAADQGKLSRAAEKLGALFDRG